MRRRVMEVNWEKGWEWEKRGKEKEAWKGESEGKRKGTRDREEAVKERRAELRNNQEKDERVRGGGREKARKKGREESTLKIDDITHWNLRQTFNPNFSKAALITSVTVVCAVTGIVLNVPAALYWVCYKTISPLYLNTQSWGKDAVLSLDEACGWLKVEKKKKPISTHRFSTF